MATDSSSPVYPKRPRFFAMRFVRLLAKMCVAKELGPDVAFLLSVIVHTEDARNYRSPVIFWNEDLMNITGMQNLKAFQRARDKAAQAGWLVYQKGARKRPARYYVAIPKQYQDVDDGPSDEGENDGYKIEEEGEITVQDSRCDSVLSPSTECPQSVLSPSTECPQSVLSPSTECPTIISPDPMPILSLSQNVPDPPKAAGSGEVEPKPPRKQSDTLHHEFIRVHGEKWKARYGASYPMVGGKDGAAVKEILKHVHDLQTWSAILDRYFADDFYRGHDLATLRGKLPRFLVDDTQAPKDGTTIPGGNPDAPDGLTVAQRDDRNLHSIYNATTGKRSLDCKPCCNPSCKRQMCIEAQAGGHCCRKPSCQYPACLEAKENAKNGVL